MRILKNILPISTEDLKLIKDNKLTAEVILKKKEK